MSWQGKAEDTGHIEELGAVQGPSFSAKLKAHFRRFWWLHLIIFIACTLIIVLCLIYVAFPHISQHDIDKSTLTVQSLILSNPTPNSFHLVQTSVIDNGSPYHPDLDAFNASLSLDGRVPYAYIEIPAVHATAQATTVVDQDVTITDLEAFIEYNINVLQNEEVNLDVKGRTALHEMSFPTTNVNYDKTATMKGLNNLTGFSITNFTIQLIPEADGTNMLGTVNIPNPSVMTLSMGNVTFNNYIGNNTDPALYVGTTSLTNLTLVPGNNTIPMRSTVNQSLVLTQIVESYQNGMLPISIVGNSSVFDGQHLVYFEKALGSVTQHVTLDVGKALMEIGVNTSALGGGGALPPPPLLL